LGAQGVAARPCLMTSCPPAPGPSLRRLQLAGTAFAATSSPAGLLSGPEQASGRLVRHWAQLHLDAAARAADAGPGSGSAAAQAPTAAAPTAIFSRPAVCLALGQHAAAALSAARVPELAGGAGLPLPAVALLLAAALEAAAADVGRLTAAGVTPSLWHFDTAALSGVVQRLCTAVATANQGSGAQPQPGGGAAGRLWGLREVLQRFAFEVRSGLAKTSPCTTLHSQPALCGRKPPCFP
jgi:dynein heavy chain